MDSNAWDKILLIAVSVIVMGLSGLFLTKALGFTERFEVKQVTPNDEIEDTDQPVVELATRFVKVKNEWQNPLLGSPEGEGKKRVPLFVSIPIVESGGKLIDMLNPNSPQLRPPLSNEWLMENDLDYLNSGVLRQDPDGDGFTNIEEWNGETSPRDAEDHPPYADKLVMIERKQTTYAIEFAARPDQERFQISRKRTAKWPRPDNFYLRIGETSEDGQFRVESFEEKSAQRRGITVDASVVEITYLPTGAKHTLVRNVVEEIPTYFAEMEFLLEPGKTFIVKQGDAFPLAKDPATKYRVVEVKENSTVITYQTGTEPEQTVEIKKK